MINFKEELRIMIDDAVDELLAIISVDLKRSTLSGIIKTTKATVDKLGASLVARIVELTDELYNKRRDKHAVVVRNYKTRKLISELGEVTLNRRLYYDKSQGKYFFAVDELLEIEKRSRIEKGLKGRLVSEATQGSYGKACRRTGNFVSRQTVSNLLQQVNINSLRVRENGFKNIAALYIEADEDHIHLKDGKSAKVKLVYVHEGRRVVNNKRNELINAKYFATVGSGESLWTAVANYVNLQYGVRRSNIQISGDGALWIKGSLNVFFGAKYRIDKFHTYKNATNACAGDKKLRQELIEIIKSGDYDGLKKLTARQKNKNKVWEYYSYIDNNFDEIDLSEEYSCSAEGHVSHVLSERMSSRPMAWTVKGADKMARLRAYLYNGGDFSDIVFKEDEEIGCEKNGYNVLNLTQKPSGHTIPTGRILLSDEVSEAVMRAVAKVLNGR